jgi:hypothetical protein
VARGEEPSK